MDIKVPIRAWKRNEQNCSLLSTNYPMILLVQVVYYLIATFTGFGKIGIIFEMLFHFVIYGPFQGILEKSFQEQEVSNKIYLLPFARGDRNQWLCAEKRELKYCPFESVCRSWSLLFVIPSRVDCILCGSKRAVDSISNSLVMYTSWTMQMRHWMLLNLVIMWAS